MCRSELAARKDILEHGKSAPALSIPGSAIGAGAAANVDSEEATGSEALMDVSTKEAAPSRPTSLPSTSPSQQTALIDKIHTAQANSSPILTSQCSGYFVQPLTWMQPIIDQGESSGKITCPNRKCGAKLGNFDWAGMKCSCKVWVTPGFCLNRSKVDEIWS
ncbi:hypothetical protein BOTBODRAFT_39370 [Botryobasidium botryosum FD-172 SS1]|uniref:protein-tyrosine-phosphatase n=1 Tax=Botryobasidium botryosum (strain FD-172 SS1) TaxID=930990 RepID=A0A067LUH9_BOTB1|nr:hypothetical protein BOTBODRAFT_39370 [Botryobasidium botryosum FD-172 SS1]